MTRAGTVICTYIFWVESHVGHCMILYEIGSCKYLSMNMITWKIASTLPSYCILHILAKEVLTFPSFPFANRILEVYFLYFYTTGTAISREGDGDESPSGDEVSYPRLPPEGAPAMENHLHNVVTWYLVPYVGLNHLMLGHTYLLDYVTQTEIFHISDRGKNENHVISQCVSKM